MPAPSSSLPSALIEQLRAGHVIPYVGAGISRAAGLPDWQELLDRIVAWAEKNGMTHGRAALIRQELVQRKFEQVANALQRDLGEDLVVSLRTILAPQGLAPTTLHQRLAAVAWPAIITTNFDSLIPQTFSGYRIITWRDQQAIGDVLKSRQAHVMMAHGALNDPASIVLTPQQYRESMHNPALRLYRETLLSHYSLLFIGVSFADPDLQHFLNTLRAALGPSAIPHYAILPDGQVSALDIEHFRENYGVEVLCYEETTDHAGVLHTVNLLIDQLPPAFLTDPAQRLTTLTLLQASRPTMSSDEYLQRFRETCQRLAADGFVHTARMALATELRRSESSLSMTERIATAIAIAQFRVEGHDIELAHQPLLELIDALEDESVDLALRLTFGATTVRMLIAGYCLKDARQLLDRIEALQTQSPLIGCLRDELLVAEYLNDGAVRGDDSREPYTRTLIAEAAAMQGHVQQQLDILLTQAEDEKQTVRQNAAILRLKRAELLHDDGQDEAAWEECEQIKPYLIDLTTTQRVAIRRNHEFLGLLLHRQGNGMLTLAQLDQEEPTKPQRARLQDLIDAHEASKKQELYASLPPLWRELINSITGCSWSARHHAHQQIARETLAAGWYKEALHHVLLGAEKEVTKELGEKIVATQDAELVRCVIGTILDRAALTRHIEPAAQLLGLLADIIPEDKVASVLSWFFRTLSRPVTTIRLGSLLTHVWEALQQVTFRLSEDQRAAVLAFAASHPTLHTQSWGRRAVLTTVGECVYQQGHADYIYLAKEVLPVATTERWDGDFAHALQLLALLATRSVEAQTLIRETLFADNTTKADLRVAALASEFGCGLLPEGVAHNAEKIVAALPLQVWHDSSAPPPFILSRIITQSGTYDGKHLQIELGGGQTELEFLRKHQSHIPPTVWDALFSAIMELLEHPYNLRSNRIMLVGFLEHTTERLDAAQAGVFLHFLRNVTKGRLTPSPAELPTPTATERYKVGGTPAEDLHALALRATTTVLHRFPHLIAGEDELGLRTTILAPEPISRRLACDCITRLNYPPLGLQLLLLTATQDPDAGVAATALDGLRSLWERGHLQEQTDLIIVLAQRSATSRNHLMRRLAMRLAAAMHTTAKEPEAQRSLETLLEGGQSDLHFTVRRAAPS